MQKIRKEEKSCLEALHPLFFGSDQRTARVLLVTKSIPIQSYKPLNQRMKNDFLYLLSHCSTSPFECLFQFNTDETCVLHTLAIP